MRHNTRTDDQAHTVQRSPAGPFKTQSVTDEKTTTSSTQGASGLGGGAPEGRRQRTAERAAIDDTDRENPTLPAGEAVDRTTV